VPGPRSDRLTGQRSTNIGRRGSRAPYVPEAAAPTSVLAAGKTAAPCARKEKPRDLAETARLLRPPVDVAQGDEKSGILVFSEESLE
jgi:hypothetical protein